MVEIGASLIGKDLLGIEQAESHDESVKESSAGRQLKGLASRYRDYRGDPVEVVYQRSEMICLARGTLLEVGEYYLGLQGASLDVRCLDSEETDGQGGPRTVTLMEDRDMLYIENRDYEIIAVSINSPKDN